MSQEDMRAADRLARVLDEQVELYGALLELSRRKQRVLVEGGLQDLERLVEAEQALLWRAGKAEERRLALQDELLGELGLPAGGRVTLSQLLQRLDGSTAERYREVAGRLKALVAELVALNAANTELVNQALAYVRFSLRSLARLGGEPPTYRPPGSPQAAAGGPSRVLNHKA
ncbi:MAG: flagellar protein FlgN [Acetobacteraceae bacterium]|nr:flagellar protein FlgN [Acetobacteraceae bacterium]